MNKEILSDKEIKNIAHEYSFLIQSELYNSIPKELKELWIKDCENHFINGFKQGLKYYFKE